MNAHSFTFVPTSPTKNTGAFPTFDAEFDLDEYRKIPKDPRRKGFTIISPTSPEGEPKEFTFVATPQDQEVENLGRVEDVNPGRNNALKRLSELEAFARTLRDPGMQAVALRSCRDAVTLLSFWPSDLVAPDADIGDDGIVSIEQFKDDGTIQAIFEFSEPERPAFAILSGAGILKRGYVSTIDHTAMMHAFGDIRLAAEDTE